MIGREAVRERESVQRVVICSSGLQNHFLNQTAFSSVMSSANVLLLVLLAVLHVIAQVSVPDDHILIITCLQMVID